MTYARPEVGRVTPTWVVDNIELQDREKGLLKLIYKHRLIRRGQIQALYPEYNGEKHLNKFLRKLYKLHMVDKFYPKTKKGEGGSQAVYCMDKTGFLYMLMYEDKNPYTKVVRTDEDGFRYLPMGWKHGIALIDYEIIIRSHFKQMHMYRKERKLKFNGTSLIPDICFLGSNNGKGSLFFVEVDLGSERYAQFKEKIDRYHDYYASMEWLKEKWAKVFKTPTFPRILLIVDDTQRNKHKVYMDYIKDSPLTFIIVSHADAEKKMRELFTQ